MLHSAHFIAHLLGTFILGETYFLCGDSRDALCMRVLSCHVFVSCRHGGGWSALRTRVGCSFECHKGFRLMKRRRVVFSWTWVRRARSCIFVWMHGPRWPKHFSQIWLCIRATQQDWPEQHSSLATFFPGRGLLVSPARRALRSAFGGRCHLGQLRWPQAELSRHVP